ncbi:tyrosine-type recombinase/integrase [Spongiactinospora rosea]|uniref:tyrosine-type recombinase/integrase n=1 Tax=Spongiactinospora rosea TaxID=2248750 RepID=UPI0018F5B0E0|nr:site-specific integrase [Spongiactinospora rosea]
MSSSASSRVARLIPADPRVAALLRVLRPEFRTERFIPPPGHFLAPVRCRVEGCPREDSAEGMCQQHRRAWRRDGVPELATWAAERRNQKIGLLADIRSCLVPSCLFAAGWAGLCDGHRTQWMSRPNARRKDTSVAEFAANADPVERLSAGRCRFPDGCGYPISDDDLCDGHRFRWQRLGRPALEDLPEALRTWLSPGFSVTGLPPLLTLELQYLLQVRTDQRTARILQSTWGCAIKVVLAEGVESLRERTLDQWRKRIARDPTVRALFGTALAALDDLDGPEDEYERDVWRPERLGFTLEQRRNVSPLKFTAITQAWLRERVKRYTKITLGRVELRTIASVLPAFAYFSRFLTQVLPDRQHDPLLLEREVLEAYLGWLQRQVNENKAGRNRGQPLSVATRIRHLSALAGFLDHWHRYGWDPLLPATARIYTEDYPRRSGLKANFIDEYLMDQIEAEENLTLLEPETRVMLLICRDEGLRIGEALTLKLDCLQRTPSGRWALVHYKSKDKSYRAIPASRVVVEAIREQHRRVTQVFGDRCQWLFPRVQANHDGRHHMTYTTITRRFDAWLNEIRLIDAHGAPARVTWHQFRHTLGTRMANAGVSGRTIREVLGHTSWEMQEHYSRISDDTLRREYEEKYEVRFNLKGQAVRIRPDTDLSAVEWLAEKIGRRLHAVSGGWCGRHISRPCPKTAADGCYTCEDFQTDQQFLPIHEDTLTRTRDMQAAAQAAGRSRAAEVNAQLATKVEHLIEKITDQASPTPGPQKLTHTGDGPPNDQYEVVADAS